MTPDEIAPAPAPDAVPPAKAARWEDFIDIFYAPSEVFRRRQGTNALVPLLIVSVIMGVITFTSFDAMRPLLDRMMADQQAMTPETEAQMAGMKGIIDGAMKFFSVVGTPMLLCFLAFFTWLAGKVFGSTQALGDAFMVVSYAWVPRVVAALYSSVILLVGHPATVYSLGLSPAALLDPKTSPVLLGVAARFDLMIIWSTVLLAIGLSVTGRISKGRAGAAAFVVWLIPTLFAVIGAMFSSAMTATK